MKSNIIKDCFEKNKKILSELNLDIIEKLASKIEETRKNGNIVFVAGNGGSSSTASHFVNDLVKATRNNDKPPYLKALSLTDNVPLITAVSNDIDYSEIFKFTLENLANSGDILIVISASGNSDNLIKAVEYCNSNNIFTSGLLGFDGGRLNNLIKLPALITTELGEYELVENMHLIVCHMISTYLSR